MCLPSIKPVGKRVEKVRICETHGNDYDHLTDPDPGVCAEAASERNRNQLRFVTELTRGHQHKDREKSAKPIRDLPAKQRDIQVTGFSERFGFTLF
jgi:hypothetical protein